MFCINECDLVGIVQMSLMKHERRSLEETNPWEDDSRWDLECKSGA